MLPFSCASFPCHPRRLCFQSSFSACLFLSSELLSLCSFFFFFFVMILPLPFLILFACSSWFPYVDPCLPRNPTSFRFNEFHWMLRVLLFVAASMPKVINCWANWIVSHNTEKCVIVPKSDILHVHSRWVYGINKENKHLWVYQHFNWLRNKKKTEDKYRIASTCSTCNPAAPSHLSTSICYSFSMQINEKRKWFVIVRMHFNEFQ